MESLEILCIVFLPKAVLSPGPPYTPAPLTHRVATLLRLLLATAGVDTGTALHTPIHHHAATHVLLLAPAGRGNVPAADQHLAAPFGCLLSATAGVARLRTWATPTASTTATH